MSLVKHTVELEQEFGTSSSTWYVALERSLGSGDGMIGQYQITLSGKAIAQLGKGHIRLDNGPKDGAPNEWAFFGAKDIYYTWVHNFKEDTQYNFRVWVRAEQIPTLSPTPRVCILEMKMVFVKMYPNEKGIPLVIVEPEPETVEEGEGPRNILL